MVNFKARTNDAEEGKSKWLGDLDLTLFLPTVFMVLFSLAEFGLLNHFNLIELGWAHWRVGAIFTVIILVFLFKKAHGGYEEAVFTVLISLVFPWVLGVLYLIGLSIFLWHLPTLKEGSVWETENIVLGGRLEFGNYPTFRVWALTGCFIPQSVWGVRNGVNKGTVMPQYLHTPQRCSV